MKGRVLIVAGSDSGGGAGIQADIKTVTMLGGYAATAITALTAQNTQGVHGVMGIDPDFIAAQMRVVIEDIGVDCIKTGMLHSSPVINAVFDLIGEIAADVPVVVDPVMMAKGGAPLLEPVAMGVLKEQAVRNAFLITPNAPEAEALTGLALVEKADMEPAAEALLALGPDAVFLKGGHMKGDIVHDLLMTRDERRWFSAPRLESKHTHGTGCTLASAIAAGIAQGMALGDAARRASDYVHEAIRTAPGFGQGFGPVNHAHPLDSTD